MAFEIRCFIKKLKVCWKDEVSNKVVRENVEKHCTIVDLIITES